MNVDDHIEMNRLLRTLHPSTVLDEMMMRWNGRWLMSGEVARCKQCQAQQWPSNAHTPINHAPNCPNAQYLHPWLNLAELLAGLPAVTS